MWNKIKNLTTKPITILLSIVLGSLIGLYMPKTANIIAPWGDLYLSLLRMCILPLVITAIISSISSFLKKPQIGAYIKKFTFFITILYVATSLFSIVSGEIAKTGKKMTIESRIQLGQIVSTSENSTLTVEKELSFITEEKKTNIFDIFTQLIPTNIFSSLVKEEIFKVVFFSLLIGIALGLLHEKNTKLLIEGINSLFHVFHNIISGVMHLLPIGLLGFMADLFQKTGYTIITAMYSYIISYSISVILLICTALIIITFALRTSFFNTFNAFKGPLLIAFGARNSIVALPITLKNFSEILKMEKDKINFLLPLGFTIFTFGVVYSFSFSSIFFAQFYDIDLNLYNYLIIIIGSIFTSFAASGNSEMIAVTMLSLILDPLGIPSKPIIIIMLALTSFIEPLGDVVTLMVNSTLAALLDSRKKTAERS